MKGSAAEGSRGSRFRTMGSGKAGASGGTPSCWGKVPRAATITTLATARRSVRSSAGIRSALRK